MGLIPDRFKHNSLFIQLFTVTFLIILIVSTTLTWTTIRMSERFFIEKFSITNDTVMNQIKESMETFNYSIVITSNKILNNGTVKRFLTEEKTDMELMTSYYKMDNQMDTIKSSISAYDVGIIISGRNGLSFSTDRSSRRISDKQLEKSVITKNTYSEPKKLLFQYEQVDKSAELGKGHVIVASKAIMEPTLGTIYGAMYFTIKETDFRNFYKSYTSGGNDVFVMDKSGMILSSNRTEFIGQKNADLLSRTVAMEEHTEKYTNAHLLGKNQILFVEYLPTFDLYLVNLIDKEEVFGDLIDQRSILSIFFALIILALIIVFLVSRKLTNSLTLLVRQIGNAPKYDFNKYVSVSGTFETRELGNAFNSMLDELGEYVEKLVQSQKQKRNAELAALQQQINPHFLYNTLTSIKFMIRQGSKEEAEDVIHALISLLQNTIGNVKETIPVKAEVDNLKNYVLINQKRYGNRIQVSYFIAPDCMEFQIPKLIIQPFVENSFFHGFNRKDNGYINVLVWKNDTNLICEVIDNGDGMEMSTNRTLPSKKQKHDRFTGIGVQNVHERIQLIYGESYGVTISSEVGEGTKVRISLPLNES